MAQNDDEEERLRAVALQNAQSILVARQHAEEALRKHSEWLRITLSSIGDAVITSDADDRITFMNGVAESLTGWSQDEALGCRLPDVFRIIDEESRRPIETPTLRALREGTTGRLAHHTVLIAKDGSERPIGERAAPIRDEQGHVSGCVLIFRDISERRRAERDLAERSVAERFLSALVDSSDDAIISKSLDGIILTWNASAERLFGYSAEQAVGRHISFLFPADRANEEDHIIARLRAGERVNHFDTVRLRSNGEPVQVSLTISPIRDATGRVVGASKIARDITERKRMEDVLRKYATELADANRRKNEFLATLAHELRNPLAPIRNAVQLLQLSGGNGDAVQATAEMLDRQVGQMVRLVDDLLDVSRISQGKIELRRERVELQSVIYLAAEGARSLVECMEHNLTITLPPEPLYLNADPTRLAQVLGNLLNNACKFTKKGGRLLLSAEREGEQAVVRVQDNGIGIATDHLPRIFEMFMQAETSLERATGGLGIGLTLVKNLVEMHGGAVEVHSAGIGQGSEFVLRLPILAETTEPVAPTVSVPPTVTARRILVVDDNRDSAQSLAMLLELSGHQTQTAHDGLQAVEVAESFRPDVVLLDIGLPKLNGYEVARKIRSEPWGSDIVLVALTGWGQEEDRRRSAEAGFDSHMVKPVDLKALMKLLASLPPKQGHN